MAAIFHGIFQDTRTGQEFISREPKTLAEWLPNAGNVPARGEQRSTGSRHNPWSNKNLTLVGLQAHGAQRLREVPDWHIPGFHYKPSF